MAHEQKSCGLCRIALEDVSVQLSGDVLLDHVSMHLHCGQLTALIGQNGAGKTTLVKALLGLVKHTGEIKHLDSAARALSSVRTGYVPQSLEFDREMPMTVEDFLAASLSRRPVFLGIGKDTRKTISEALESVSALPLMKKRLGALSGGELQRVLLALAVTPAPDLLILDEPVSGIDNNGLAMFLSTVLELRQRHHMAILLVSHDLELVKRYADNVVLLSKSVLLQGPPDEVYSSDAFKRIFTDFEGRKE